MKDGDFYCHMCREWVSEFHHIPRMKGINPKSEFYGRICINCWQVYKAANGIERTDGGCTT